MSHPHGRSEFQRANPKDNVPEDTIVIAKDGGESVAERNGRLVGAAVRATLSSNRGPEDPRPARRRTRTPGMSPRRRWSGGSWR